MSACPSFRFQGTTTRTAACVDFIEFCLLYAHFWYTILQDKNLAALDLFSMCGFINYFGKVNDLNNVEIYPVLMEKGSTKLAMFGLSHVRDERLYRIFEQKQFRLYRPAEFKDEWFNLFIIHQNRFVPSLAVVMNKC
jgi:hypothetical protein